MKVESEGMLNSEILQKYAIVDRDADFESALQNGLGKISSSGLISVKSNRKKVDKKHEKLEDMQKGNKKRGNDGGSSKLKKKKKS